MLAHLPILKVFNLFPEHDLSQRKNPEITITKNYQIYEKKSLS